MFGTALLVAMAVSLATPAPGQAVDAEAAAVVEAVRTQLRLLGGRQVDALARTFTDDGVIVVSRRRGNEFVNTVTPIGEWLDRARANQDGAPFEERISDIQVTVDSGHLAHLRADFEIVVGGVVRSSGVDHFTLVKEPDGWKTAVLAYSSIPAAP